MNFNEYSLTVAESDVQISMSLRIDGKFFLPVWAVVEIIDGTATGWCAYDFYMLESRCSNHALFPSHCDTCLQILKTSPVQCAIM